MQVFDSSATLAIRHWIVFPGQEEIPMSVSPEYRAQIMERLGQVAPVRARNMFGELGLYLGEQLFGMMVDDGLYFRVDDVNRPDYEAAGIGPFIAPWSGKPTKYYAVPAAVLADDTQLGAWVDKAVAVATRQPKPPPRKRG
jgi:DNA transformation protein